MKRIVTLFIVLAICALMCGCSDYTLPDTAGAQLSAPQSGDTIAVFNTSKGTIKAKLFVELCPQTAANFIGLAQKGAYDGLVFHRVIEDLLVQSGDPEMNGTGAESFTGAVVPNEFTNELRNYFGAVGMASSSNGENKSQFYIVAARAVDETVKTALTDAGYAQDIIDNYASFGGEPSFDFRYTVFAQVYEGFEVLERIANVGVDELHRPKKDVKLKSVTIEIIP